MSDNLYNNPGDDMDRAFYGTVPDEVTEEIAAKEAPQAASYPIMPSIAEWFEEQISACGNISNIQIQSLTVNGVKYSRDVSVEAQVLAYQLLQQLLADKYNEFKGFTPDEQ